MTYFKIIADGKFICVVSDNQCGKYQLKHRIDLWCPINEAQFFITEYGFFRDDWMLPVKNKPNIIKASIITIDEDEYNELKEVESYEILPELEEPQEIPQEEIIDLETQITVDYVREKKLLQMETATKNAITNGFDIDGLHYSLTIQDQLNLITLANMVNAGNDRIPYHADGELCRYFTAAEMQEVITKAYEHIARYTTYFNSIKYWIESLKNIDEIKSIYFGIDIPDEYKSEVLKENV